MTVTFRCPSCHTTFRVEDSSLGKTVICPNPGCNRKAVLPKGGETKPGGTKLVKQSRPQPSVRAAEPVVEKSKPTALEDRPQQQIINKTEISKEVLLIAGIGSAAVILISVLGLVLVLRQSPKEQDSLVAATDVAATDQTASAVKIGDELQQPVSATESAAQSPASATNDEQSSLKQQSPVTVNSKGSDASADESTQSQSLTFEEVASRTKASIAFIEGEAGSGTGFLIQDGILATNRHVINEELIEQLKIHFPSAPAGEQGPFTAELTYKDPDNDLAFLKVETSLAPLTAPAQYSFRPGQQVMAIGSPLGLKNAINTGVLSSEIERDGRELYQLGIAITYGNSGGPVLDMSGQVLGVAQGGFDGTALAFCIPLHKLTEALAKADNLTESEIAVMRSEHRLGVVVHTVSTTGSGYEKGMEIYLDSMKQAMKSGGTASSGLDNVRDKVTDALRGLDRRLVDADLSREASRVSSDPNIPDRIRGQFAELWTNYKELKSNVENPRGTVETFEAKFLRLSDNHDRLMHALNLHLGIKEE